MALLLAGPGFGYSDVVIGLIGIVGIAGALMANVAGRMADKGLEQSTTLAGAILMLLGWLCLWLGGSSIWWLAVISMTITNDVIGVCVIAARKATMPSTRMGVPM